MADFVLVYTVLRRDVACRMECSRLRAAHGILATQFGVSPRVGVAKSRGVAWFALSRAFPQTQGISFLALSP